MTPLKDFLKELLNLPGLSAYESPVRERISVEWKPLVDELSTSNLGSLHGLKKGNLPEPRPRILLAAHMDGIGMMTTGFADSFIRFTEIGGLDPRILPGQIVTIHGKKEIPGVVAATPDRLLPSSQRGDPPGLEHLLVDTGVSEKELKQLVHVGDLISFAQKPFEMEGDLVVGHSQDNRASVAVLTQTLMDLQRRIHGWDVWAVATTQEEETLAGAYTSSFEIRPDLAIAIDVTFGKGPGASDYRAYPLMKGLSIGWGPNVHSGFHRSVKDLAERLDIPFQVEIMPRHSGTDAFGMQVVAEGVPTLVIGVPLRYMHSPVEMVAMKDIERGGRLLAEFISRLKPDFTQNLTWDEEL